MTLNKPGTETSNFNTIEENVSLKTHKIREEKVKGKMAIIYIFICTTT